MQLFYQLSNYIIRNLFFYIFLYHVGMWNVRHRQTLPSCHISFLPVIAITGHYWDSANEGHSLLLSGEQKATGQGLDPWPHILLVITPADSASFFYPAGRSFAHDLCHGSIPRAWTSPRVPLLIKEVQTGPFFFSLITQSGISAAPVKLCV